MYVWPTVDRNSLGGSARRGPIVNARGLRFVVIVQRQLGRRTVDHVRHEPLPGRAEAFDLP